MDIRGEYDIPADRQTVWQAINDPDVLRDCIPGCDALTPTDDGSGFDATVTAKVGPVKATLNGTVTLTDVQEAQRYTIVGEGKGAAGFAKLTAPVTLEDNGDGGTRLSYTAQAQLGGKLAQLGSRLVQSTARKYADQFFGALNERLSGGETAAAPADAGVTTQGEGGGNTWMIYGGVGLAVLILLLLFLL
ncbi:carbon monoxide dehydrogenase subunit G [Aquisalimonas sp.]|uniref:SRPBCC family protein n=1 Tax=unclassified Aquisalimonas TaxID=2644645 RepID=UPI0025C081A0|nr:carbon monoxide dehydrogenase subunit G [Aquisalimonas sp.]